MFTEKLSFPWSISINDFTCYTVQHGHTLNFLKPISLSATIGLSTRPSKQTETSIKLNPFSQYLAEDNTTIGCLGVCIHVDMSAVTVSISEVQVCLMASILYGLLNVMKQIAPALKKYEQKSPEPTPPVVVKTSQSPTILQKESTQDSTSEQSNSITLQANQENEDVKLTAWIQWTIARFTVKVYTQRYDDVEEFSHVKKPSMMLVLDAEDIVSSLDFQSVYLKIKSKVGTANIKHYERTAGRWVKGAFRGLVMIPVEEAVERQEDTSFFSVTITRASCQHTHTLWGANRKQKLKEKVGKIVTLRGFYRK